MKWLARLDQQVKIRGFRIELGEIEAALRLHPHVEETVVICREDEPMKLQGYLEEKQVVAYVVRAQESLEISELRSYLQGRLPEYMVPQAFVVLEKLPLTPNGKIDRKALPAPLPGSPKRIQGHRPPRTPTEIRLSHIWAEVLQVPQVGISDNFFDLGGHSLLAMIVVTEVREPTVPGYYMPITMLSLMADGALGGSGANPRRAAQRDFFA